MMMTMVIMLRDEYPHGDDPAVDAADGGSRGMAATMAIAADNNEGSWRAAMTMLMRDDDNRGWKALMSDYDV